MTCEACRDNEAVDGIVPRCRTEAGCVIPQPDADGCRALDLWQRLNLAPEGCREYVLRLRGATLWDFELMNVIAEEVRANGK